eukprot:CAMPEP_0172480746 /NCGR_PEP_ID=MMETSP1066-20121228/6151_1 /TAXON_ID=671091 /ORGANISM="Coscinodiscus wailesii, Strain CCMP2513" /LENGTH=162 /DNA_ID=CAMNT_0013242377 /DNA_START=272 /DNA_END=760 /DNA_ORIENTATION=-
MPILSAEPVEQCTVIFKSVDTDNSGSIDHLELENALSQMAEKQGFQKPTKEQIDAHLKEIDTSGDGKVDLKEFIQFIAFMKVMVICSVLFDAVDADKSGSIDKSELKALLTKLYEGEGMTPPTDDEVAEYVKELDKSGDGSIDFGEFASFMIPVIIEASMEE